MTAPLLPTDGCPSASLRAQCIRSISTHPGDSLIVGASYRCPACGHQWWTSWSIDTLTLPCPGCPACTNTEGAEVA